MSAPAFQCVIALVEKIMALIDGGNARDRSGLVIENFIGDVRRDAEACHPRYASAPQIVKTPVLYVRLVIKLPLRKGESLKRFGPMNREYENSLLLHPLQDGDRLSREVNGMLFRVLGARLRQRPSSLVKIELIPGRTRDFLAALSGQRQEFNDATVRATHRSGGEDDLGQFWVS